MALKKRTISKEEINLLPPMEWEGEIIEIVTPEGAKKALSILCEEKYVGFDTETRPSFKKGESYTPAILQLGTKDRAFIFRLKLFTPPQELLDFLSDENILKVGVAVRDDVKGLQKIMEFEPKGFFDLSVEVRKTGYSDEGLRSLTAIFLGKRLSKGAKFTNWERSDLDETSLHYAALDAAIGVILYEKIMGIN